MTTAEITNIAAVLVSPVVAVLITLWLDGRRKDREQKITVLRLLLATRRFPGDPNYQTAVNLIPVEFGRSKSVMSAYKDFIKSVAPGSATDSSVTMTRLIYEVAKRSGFAIRETDIQTDAYASQGWVDRDNLYLDSLKAQRDINTTLLLQARLMTGAPLLPQEREFLGLPPSGHTEIPNA
ncbi:DUF6680 family protein [Sphingomonas sp.]|uniref:DUF6680 family protein n=1 Tax=Sphingomonas sp. TaxID=28214 RepID=UPI003B004FF1